MIRLRPTSTEGEPQARRRGRPPGSRNRVPQEGDGNDAALIAKFQTGDDTAFRALVTKYSNLVGSIAYNIVNDVHIASDITQETFLKVYRNLKDLEDPRKFKGWLCCIVRTTCIDHLRKDRVRPTSLEKIAEDGMEPEDTILNAAVEAPNLEAEELRERVLHAIRDLPDIYREIIILRHLRRMSYREMSRHLGVGQATIESRLYRARLMLKDKLQDYYL